MGVDDEYKMVSAQDEANDHLLERAGPISRSAYKKRSMFLSIALGAVVGAGVMFLFSMLFANNGYSFTKPAPTPTEAAKAEVQRVEVPVTTTATVTAPATTITQTVKVPAAAVPAQQNVDEAHLTTNGEITDCGHTVEEARAKGCVFDVMMQDWMPRPCYDEALSERYLLAGNWSWWADQEATTFLSLEEMRKGEHSVIYVIQDYHRQHCIYAWEKMVRAIRNDWPLIEELISYDHVMHCRHSTLSKESENIRGVRAPTAWTRCGLVKDWYGRFPGNSVSSVDKRSAEARFTEWYNEMP